MRMASFHSQLIIIFVSALTLTGALVMDKLLTETLYKPSDCSIKSRRFNVLTVHFEGSTSDGKVFASSWEQNEPVSFQLWKVEVIHGLNVGLLDMCVGEKRKLTVPKHLIDHRPGVSYKIPAPNELILIYEVELLQIEKVTHPRVELFERADTDSDLQLSRDEMSTYFLNDFTRRVSKGEVIEAKEAYQVLQNREAYIDRMFKFEDIDKDGIISQDEFLGRFRDEL